MIAKITYAKWDGEPAVLLEFDDGRIHGYYYTSRDRRWRNGGHAADIAFRDGTLTKAEYDELFPDVGLPPAAFTPRRGHPGLILTTPMSD
jgi:hypothetical protein